MTNTRSTKCALMASVLSLILCLSMLLGTTYAWFTDTVTSGTNKIVAGNLDVELVHTSSSVTTETSVDAATNLFVDPNGDEILWEPGVVAWENLTVKNLGTLALKYKLAVNFANENYVNENGAKLSQILKVGLVENGITATEREDVLEQITKSMPLESFELDGVLSAKTNAPTVGIVIYWEPSDNDNDWNVNNGKTTSDGKALHIDLGISLYATQQTQEKDSFNDQYDKDAEYRFFEKFYPFDSADELNDFDPILVNPTNTKGHGLTVVDGKAVVNDAGAYIRFDADIANYKYFIEYDVDATALAEGKGIDFNSGNDGAYDVVNYVSVINNGGLKLSVGPAANNKTGYVDSAALGNTFHVQYAYSLEDGKWNTAVTITDGTNTYTASKSGDYNSAHDIFWDIEVCDPNGGVAIDNFTFYANEYRKTIEIPAPPTVPTTTNNVTVTPDTISGMTFEDDTTYTFSGTFAETEIKVPAEVNVVLDGSNATFTGQLKITFGSIHDGAASAFDGDALKSKVGNYTVQNFETTGSISIGTINTNLIVLNNKAQAIDITADNTKIIVYGNVIDGELNQALKRYDGYTNQYGFYLYGFAYDLSFINNTISDTYSHAFAINGGDIVDFAYNYRELYKNAIGEFIGNVFNMSAAAKDASRSAVKIWDDNTFALVNGEPNTATQDLMTTIRSSVNTVNKTTTTQTFFDINGYSCN